MKLKPRSNSLSTSDSVTTDCTQKSPIDFKLLPIEIWFIVKSVIKLAGSTIKFNQGVKFVRFFRSIEKE